MKSADDSVIISLLQDEEMSMGLWSRTLYSDVMLHFTYLMPVKLQICQLASGEIQIHSQTYTKGYGIDFADSYMYLGNVIDYKLNLDVNLDCISITGQQRLYFLKMLNTFNVNQTLMT